MRLIEYRHRDIDTMKASGMGLGESDDPPAQELLSRWPELCRKYDIPCSAMHVGLVKDLQYTR